MWLELPRVGRRSAQHVQRLHVSFLAVLQHNPTRDFYVHHVDKVLQSSAGASTAAAAAEPALRASAARGDWPGGATG